MVSLTLARKPLLSKWLQVVDVTSANQGILMNRFSRTLSIPALTVEEEANWFWAKTYAGDRYDFTNGTFKPDGQDRPVRCIFLLYSNCF